MKQSQHTAQLMPWGEVVTYAAPADHGVRDLHTLRREIIPGEDQPDDLWSLADLEEWSRGSNARHRDPALRFISTVVLRKSDRFSDPLGALGVLSVPAVSPVAEINLAPVWPRQWLQTLYLRLFDLLASEASRSEASGNGTKDRWQAVLDVIGDAVQPQAKGGVQ